VDRRCARRSVAEASASADDLGFRCCRDAKNAATIPPAKWQETFRKATISPREVADLVKAAPHLAEIAGDDLAFFKDDDVKAVLSRADAGAPPQNVTLTAQPLLWSPVPGEEVLVVSGKSGKNSFVLAFHVLSRGRYRIASSMILRGEKGPVVLGYNPYTRRKVGWGSCWDCNAESGSVTFREDNRVVVIQK